MENGKQPALPQSDLGHALLKEGKISSEYGFGLTKREYVAIMAMQGLIANPSQIGDASEYELVATHAKGHADALLKALEE